MVKKIEGDLTGARAYRALLSLAFEHKGYFALAVIGMVIFAASDAAFAYLIGCAGRLSQPDVRPVLRLRRPLEVLASGALATFVGYLAVAAVFRFIFRIRGEAEENLRLIGRSGRER